MLYVLSVFAGCHNEKNLLQGLYSFISYTDLKERFLVNNKAVFYAEITDVQPNFPVISIHRAMGTAERFKLIELPRNNSRFTWKITQFSSFNGEDHSSYEFTVGQRRWYANHILSSVLVEYARIKKNNTSIHT